jgi:hypothetical protein
LLRECQQHVFHTEAIVQEFAAFAAIMVLYPMDNRGLFIPEIKLEWM